MKNDRNEIQRELQENLRSNERGLPLDSQVVVERFAVDTWAVWFIDNDYRYWSLDDRATKTYAYVKDRLGDLALKVYACTAVDEDEWAEMEKRAATA